jgi:RNA polymerase sigma-70 factor (ECF subfamily)
MEDDDSLVAPVILADWTGVPDRVIDDVELTESLDAAIAGLPEIYRAIFILREIDQLSVEETAAIAGISPGAVKVRHHRARLFLRERLAEMWFSQV